MQDQAGPRRAAGQGDQFPGAGYIDEAQLRQLEVDLARVGHLASLVAEGRGRPPAELAKREPGADCASSWSLAQRRYRFYPFTMTGVKPLAESPGPGGVGEWVSPVRFRVDSGSGVPIYLQLVHQVEHALRLGYLQVGDQLPRIRDVVGSLSINPNTVAKAYRELEHEGYAAGRVGQGTFIVATPATVAPDKLDALRESLVGGWLRDAATAGLSEQEIVALFMSALRESAGGTAGREPGDTAGPGGQEEAVA